MPPRLTDDELAEQLRAAGLRRTEPRLAVLRYMRRARRPVTHAEVASALGRLELDRVSVYRVLIDLARVKILTRQDMGDHVWRFGVASADAPHGREHPHFVCTGCGKSVCLPDGSVVVGRAPRTPRALRRREVEVQVRGECDDCAPG